MTFEFLPTTIQPLAQKGFLERKFHKALTIRPGYRVAASPFPIPGQIGSSITLSKVGHLTPTITPVDGTTRVSNLDNGLTADQAASEQYTFFINEYAKTVDLNLM